MAEVALGVGVFIVLASIVIVLAKGATWLIGRLTARPDYFCPCEHLVDLGADEELLCRCPCAGTDCMCGCWSERGCYQVLVAEGFRE